MSESAFPAKCEANLRRARIEAKWSMRCYQRDFGRRDPAQLIHDIRMAGWLFERIRVEAPALSQGELLAMQAQLLRKLATAEMVATAILGSPAQVAKCSK